MRHPTPKLFTTPSATPRLRRKLWLAAAALAASDLALAGLPAAPASVAPSAAAQTATLSAANQAAQADTSRQTWHGVTYDDLVAGWSRWLLSIPLGVSPLAATETGINCAISQGGAVWNLAAPGGVTYTRTCTVPAGKALVMPVASYIDDYPCPPAFGFEPPPDQSLEDFLRADAAAIMSGTIAYATLDNKPLPVKHVATGVFSFTAAAGLGALGDACLTGSPQLAVMDGMFLFIDPPAPGTHVLQVSATNPFFGTTTGTITLMVKK